MFVWRKQGSIRIGAYINCCLAFSRFPFSSKDGDDEVPFAELKARVSFAEDDESTDAGAENQREEKRSSEEMRMKKVQRKTKIRDGSDV